MVGAENRIYLVTGGSFFQRRRAIDKIKKEISAGKDLSISSATLYSKDIDTDSLKELSFTYSFQKKKIILFKNFTALSKAVKKFLAGSLEKVLKSNYLIFESEQPYFSLKKNKRITSDSFYKAVFNRSIKYQGKDYSRKVTVEDFRRKLYARDFDSCLFIAEKILRPGSKNRIIAAQILGMLVSRYSYLKKSQKKDEIFAYLWEADRALKQSNLDIRLVMERLLAKLFA